LDFLPVGVDDGSVGFGVGSERVDVGGFSGADRARTGAFIPVIGAVVFVCVSLTLYHGSASYFRKLFGGKFHRTGMNNADEMASSMTPETFGKRSKRSIRAPFT